MLQLENLIPHTLKDRASLLHSEVWGRSCTFAKENYIKLTAPSGTGKTTLMHFLYGNRNDYSGTILLNDVNITHLHAEQLSAIRSNKLAIVFQDLRLFPQLSLRENIELKRLLYPSHYTPVEVAEMATRLGLLEVLDQPAGICSYGEQQRAAIIRALVAPFDWLLLDEPFSHLDESNTQKAASLINQVCREQKAGFILADLDADQHFTYTHSLQL